MALFHLSVTQTKRSAGQSAIASAAYRAGERLYSEYYGEYSDYTRKGGVICSDILLPSHAPKEYADRQTLWNAVEKAERGKTAQLAYSFEISLQNEFSLEENIALARKFLLEQFVSRGMTVDVSFHEKEHEDGGTPNPHFHFLCPIRPIEQDGTWGLKQRRVYALDEDGNRIRDQNGEFVFNAVPTTDWGSPETLEHWRQTWAEMCNAKFAEKGLTVRIDHRSYERQGVDLLPTIHEGATVRAMEKKGIRTEKGEFNRWIKATNAVIRDIKKKITLLFDWIAEAKAELAKPQTPDLVSLLNAYYTQRRAGAYSQKGKVSNLKEMNETFNYLRANGIYTLEDLESHVNEHSSTTESLKKTLDGQTARMKEIKQLYDSSAAFQNLKPVYDGLQKIKFEKPRAKYKAEHEAKLKQFYAARRKLTGEFPDGKVDMKKLTEEYDELEQAHETTYGEFKTVRDDLHRLWKVKSCVDTATRFNERTEEQKRTDAAIARFSDATTNGVVTLRPFDDYYNGYTDEKGKYNEGYVDMIAALQQNFPLSDVRIVGENWQKTFIRLFGAILRMRNLLVAFDDFNGKEILSERDMQDYMGRYQDLYDEWRGRSGHEKEDITDDVVFEIELIKQIEINIDYILILMQKYHDSHGKDKEIAIAIQKAVESSSELRSKKALIQGFLAGINEVDDVINEWHDYVATQKETQLAALIAEERLKDAETRQFMANAFRDGAVKTTGMDIDNLLPPMSRFGGGNRAEKKRIVTEKLVAFFNRFFGIG